MNEKNHSKQMYELCKKHMHSYVLVETADGMTFDGIITGLDDEYVYMAVPNDAHAQHPGCHSGHMDDMDHHTRQFGFGYGYPGYGYNYGYGGSGFYGPPNRFRRVVLPLAALTALSLLAWY